MRLVILLLLILLVNSCIKNEFEDYELPENKYGKYEDKMAVTGVQLSVVPQVRGGCNYYFKLKTDTSDMNVNPKNIQGVDIYRGDYRYYITSASILDTAATTWFRECRRGGKYIFQLRDKEHHPIGKPTIFIDD